MKNPILNTYYNWQLFESIEDQIDNQTENSFSGKDIDIEQELLNFLIDEKHKAVNNDDYDGVYSISCLPDNRNSYTIKDLQDENLVKKIYYCGNQAFLVIATDIICDRYKEGYFENEKTFRGLRVIFREPRSKKNPTVDFGDEFVVTNDWSGRGNNTFINNRKIFSDQERFAILRNAYKNYLKIRK